MPRWFNTAGPCQADNHYMLPPVERLPGLAKLIDRQGYFVIHAPRQSGKTTAMAALARQLTDSDRFAAVLVSCEMAVPLGDNLEQAELALLEYWWRQAQKALPASLHPPDYEAGRTGTQISAALGNWAEVCPLPIVLFIDEIDAIQDNVLISVLRQLRANFPERPKRFPQSVALIGLRDVRDYKVASGGSGRLQTASPFNIKIASLTLENFTAREIELLYQQHTEETGQVFLAEAVAEVYELTQGQPWLVNAIAAQITDELVPDREIPITAAHVVQAKQQLIKRQDTHLDSLAERLQEARVRRVIEPMLAGQELGEVSPDDRQYVIDLGLVKRHPSGGLVIANPIYREVLPQVLASSPQDSLPLIAPSWLTPQGQLDTGALLDAFLAFWRQHGQPLLGTTSYHEIAPHLVLMAFLHRVVNGGGSLEREYAIASGRMDLCLRYGEVTLGIELKVWREGRPDPLGQGLEQLDRYLEGLGLDGGWLVIFDRRAGLPEISERTRVEEMRSPANRSITVIRG